MAYVTKTEVPIHVQCSECKITGCKPQFSRIMVSGLRIFHTDQPRSELLQIRSVIPIHTGSHIDSRKAGNRELSQPRGPCSCQRHYSFQFQGFTALDDRRQSSHRLFISHTPRSQLTPTSAELGLCCGVSVRELGECGWRGRRSRLRGVCHLEMPLLPCTPHTSHYACG